jgi:tetratricopeptide (TPR) repeat protein
MQRRLLRWAIIFILFWAIATWTTHLPTKDIYRSNTYWIQHMRQYQQQIEADPKNAAIPMNFLANAYVDQGKIDLAIQTYKRSIALNPDLPNAYNGLGNIYENRHDYVKALEYFTQSIARGPHQYYFAYINRGYTYFLLSQLDKALEDFNEAAKIDPRYANTYFNLGLVYQRQGNLPRALENYQKAISLAPNDVSNAVIYEKRAEIYKIMGNDKAAQADSNMADYLEIFHHY